MSDRTSLLSKVDVGHIFHASCSSNDASAICMATNITATAIAAIRITTYEILVFNRSTGISVEPEDVYPFIIDSVATLPLEVQDDVRALYVKFEPGGEDERYKLTAQEIQLILFLGKFYSSNPLA